MNAMILVERRNNVRILPCPVNLRYFGKIAMFTHFAGIKCSLSLYCPSLQCVICGEQSDRRCDNCHLPICQVHSTETPQAVAQGGGGILVKNEDLCDICHGAIVVIGEAFRFKPSCCTKACCLVPIVGICVFTCVRNNHVGSWKKKAARDIEAYNRTVSPAKPIKVSLIGFTAVLKPSASRIVDAPPPAYNSDGTDDGALICKPSPYEFDYF